MGNSRSAQSNMKRQVIDLTVSSDVSSDDDIQIIERPIKPLPARIHRPIGHVQTVHGNVLGPSRASSSIGPRSTSAVAASRKGKEVDRGTSEGARRREGKEDVPVAAAITSTIQTPRAHQGDSQGNHDIPKGSSRPTATGPPTHVPEGPIVGSETALLRTLNGSRTESQAKAWKYLKCEAPATTSGNASLSGTFKCSWPKCPVILKYHEIAGRDQCWDRQVLSTDRSIHDHRGPAPAPTSAVPGDRQQAVRNRSLATQPSPTIRDDASPYASPSASRQPRRASPVKINSPQTQPSKSTGPRVRQQTLSFAPRPTGGPLCATAARATSDATARPPMSKVPSSTSVGQGDSSTRDGPVTAGSSSKTPLVPREDRSTNQDKARLRAAKELSTPQQSPIAGAKRKHGIGFGSHAKRERDPFRPAIGRELRNRLLDSPDEVSRLTHFDPSNESPWNPKAMPMDRHLNRSRTSAVASTQGSPSPSVTSRQDQPPGGSATALVAGPIASHLNRPRASSPLKQAPQVAPDEPQDKSSSSSARPARGSASSVRIEQNPPSSLARRTLSQQDLRQTTPRDTSESPRSKRPRPAAGTYTVPSMDAEQWPSTPGSSGKTKQSASRYSLSTSSAVQADFSPMKATLKAASTSRLAPSRTPQAFSSTPRANASVDRSSSKRPLERSASFNASQSTGPPIYVTPSKVAASPLKRNWSVRKTPLHAVSSLSSIGTTPTPGKAKSDAARTPVKKMHSPEEEEEEVEDLEPVVDKDDLLAEFDNFQFDPMEPMSPLQATRSLVENTPQTPTRPSATPGLATPSARVSQTVLQTPESRNRVLADTSKANLATPMKQSSQAHQSPSVTLSPHPLKTSTKATENLVSSILARAEQSEAVQKRLRKEQEERAKRLAVLKADEPLDDSVVETSVELTIHDDNESQSGRSETGNRRSQRLRTGSLQSQSQSQSQARPNSRPSSRTGTKSIPPPRPKPDASHMFFKEQARRNKQGIGIAASDRVLRAIRESESPTKTDMPYPTPDSNRDASSGASDDEQGVETVDMDLDALADREEFGDLLDVAREAQESKQTSAGESAVPKWGGFWTTSGKLATSVGDVQSQWASAPSPSTHPTGMIAASVLAAGGYLTGLSPDLDDFSKRSIGTQFVAAVAAVLQPGDPAESQYKLTAVLHAIQSADADPFGDERKLLGLCCSIWRSHGARPEICAHHMSDPGTTAPAGFEATGVSRELVSDAIVQVLHAAIQRPWYKHADEIAPILLLLAVDPTTSAALRRDIELTIDRCWNDQSISNMIPWARDQESLPWSVKVQVLHVVGQRASAARAISRRIALEWLLSDDQTRSASGDAVDLHAILTGAERIYDMVRQPEPPLDVIGDLVTLLFESSSDMESLIENTHHDPSTSDTVHPVENLRALLGKIGHTLRSKGSNAQRLAISQLKLRVFTLGSVLEMQYSTISQRLSQARIASRLENKGLKEGKNGQTTLSLRGT